MRVLVIAALAAALVACEDPNASSGSAGDGGTCGTETCGDAQVCLYRECTTKEKCVPSAQCPRGTTPADCGGQPGCLYPNCAPKLQGCRAIPDSCGGDVTCACGSICGSAAACAEAKGRNALCAATN
ncbi:MAG: hypothetical protein R3B36_00220 [Polyangiaceae bacterium]